MEAYRSAWIIGDHFVRDTIQALYDMRNKAIASDQPQPFIFKHFNIHGFYTTASGVQNVTNRLIYAFIDALNTYHQLPQYLIVIPDKDLLVGPDKSAISIIMGAILHYIIKQIDLFIERRHTDLLAKKPGALLDDKFPKIVWVRMAKRPKIAHHLYALRSKFNAILEERLTDGKADNHYIISIDVDLNEFDFVGNLTSAGKTHFWLEIIKGMQRFHENEISLRPNQFTKKKNRSSAEEDKRKLPLPPPKSNTNLDSMHAKSAMDHQCGEGANANL